MQVLKGIPASPGVAVGEIFVFSQPSLPVAETRCLSCHRCAWFSAGNEACEIQGPLSTECADHEMLAYRAGVNQARRQLELLVDRVRREKGDDLAGVFEGHLEILSDDELNEQITDLISSGKLCALGAIRESIEIQRKEFLALDDEYLRERADDLSDIGRRLLYATAGVEFSSLSDHPDHAIIIARDLTPSDTAQLDPARVGGFVVETGGRTCHTAIMARTLELPAIVGCYGIMNAVATNSVVAINGETGEVVVAPDAATQATFYEVRESYLADRDAMLALASSPATTTDGTTVVLGVNIGTPADALASLPWNPDGVGLYRSEFLFMDRSELPSEDEQLKSYASVVRAMKGKPVILRTLDIGGDKPVPAVPFPHEENPFLGWRGLRMFLRKEDGYQDVFRTQLRAAMRAGADGDLWVMFPMISSYEEVLAVKTMVSEAWGELVAAGKRCGSVKIGIMIETPGAALIADKLAQIVDFFSIGSNDLTQYTLAADRGNERVSRCYQPFHPGVWRLISEVIKAGKAHKIPVGMCGELAGIEEAALPLLGLGLDEFSMSAQSLPRIKRIIRSANMNDARRAAQLVLDARTAEDAYTNAKEVMKFALSRFC